MKEQLEKVSVGIGGIGYLYMIYITYSGTGEGLSLSTFALWGILALVIGFNMRSQNANYGVPMMYGAGALITAIILLAKGRYGWSGFDTLICTIVILCIVIWNTVGAKWALYLSVAGAVIAAIPFVLMTLDSPLTSPIFPNSMFLLANVLSFTGAKEWTLKDRLYPSANIAVCLILIVPWLLSQ